MNISKIKFKIGTIPVTTQIIEVYESSGIVRPLTDVARIKNMYSNSNLVVSAWDDDTLVGIARSLTDYCYVCYLSDLAVKKEYQKQGIGKHLIDLIKKEVGEQTTLILLSAINAMEYYPKVGFQKIENGFIIKRKK